MESLKLIEPDLTMGAEHAEMLNEWLRAGESLVPFTLKYDTSDFQQYVRLLSDLRKGIGIPETFVPHSTFWMINRNRKIIGVSNVRHYLNERLMAEGGHIGFGIKPSERKKGYGTEILRLTLIKAGKMKIEDVLVTCDKENTGSSKIIIKNGGQFWKEHIFEGRIIQNYWINKPFA